MKILFSALVLFFLTINVSGQDNTVALKKFDEQMIHFYKRGYLRNGNYHTLADLRLEMKMDLPSYDLYRQYKKSKTNQLIASLFSIGGTVLYFSALENVNNNESRFWAGVIITAVSAGFSIHFEGRKIKFLTLAVKTRNREILAGQ